MKCPKCGSARVERYVSSTIDCMDCGHMGSAAELPNTPRLNAIRAAFYSAAGLPIPLAVGNGEWEADIKALVAMTGGAGG